MPTFTNPTGTINATEGDDTIIFNAYPSESGVAVDALGGYDSLFVQIDTTDWMTFEALDTFDSGVLNTAVSIGAYGPVIYAQNVEDIDLYGTSNSDVFRLALGSDASGLAVRMDGGAGDDDLHFDWSKLSSGISFVVSATGSAAASAPLRISRSSRSEPARAATPSRPPGETMRSTPAPVWTMSAPAPETTSSIRNRPAAASTAATATTGTPATSGPAPLR